LDAPDFSHRQCHLNSLLLACNGSRSSRLKQLRAENSALAQATDIGRHRQRSMKMDTQSETRDALDTLNPNWGDDAPGAAKLS
jgi:hypothetical protein